MCDSTAGDDLAKLVNSSATGDEMVEKYCRRRSSTALPQSSIKRDSKSKSISSKSAHTIGGSAPELGSVDAAARAAALAAAASVIHCL